LSFALLLDENVDVRLAALLRQGGHDILTTVEAGRANRALSDADQLEFATQAGRAIFTHNVKDFVPLATQWHAQGKRHSGIVVCERKAISELHQRLLLLFDAYPDGIADMCLRPPVVAS